jgi:hypothetical protein
MKRYLVFSGACYYANGGWSDFDSDHDTLEDANKARKLKHDKNGWSEVVDSELRKAVIEQVEERPVVIDPSIIHLECLVIR